MQLLGWEPPLDRLPLLGAAVRRRRPGL